MSKQSNDLITLNAGSDMNAGETVTRKEQILYINAFNTYPVVSVVFRMVSFDFFDEVCNSDDWQLLTYNSGMSLSALEDEEGRGIDFKPQDHSFNDKEFMKYATPETSYIFYNENVGMLLFSEPISPKGWHNLIRFAAHDVEESYKWIEDVRFNHLMKFDDKKPMVNVIKEDNPGCYSTKTFEINHYDIEFDKYYEHADKLKELNDDILKKVTNDNEEQSFYILHGEPGTGKTSYIKYLMTSIKKSVIYIPPHMVDIIADPKFINFMADNSNSVLIIEDAEDVVQKDDKRSNGLSNLLNMTDGILGDCFKMDVICTFNTDLRNIDEALTRSGRLNGIFQFRELSYEKAKDLCDEVGVEVPEKGHRTLANILGNNQDKEMIADSDVFPNDKNKIGFMNGDSKKELNGANQ